jgi:Ca2+-transporting ATPase
LAAATCRGRAGPSAVPRPATGLPDEPLVGRRSAGWTIVVGAVHATVALSVIAVAEHTHSLETARSLGLTTFALMNVLFSCAARGGEQSAFSPETFADRTYLAACAASLVAIVVAVESRTVGRILETTQLTFAQWMLCVVAAATVLAAAEVRRVIRLRGHPIEAMPPRGTALSVGSWRHRTYTDMRR